MVRHFAQSQCAVGECWDPEIGNQLGIVYKHGNIRDLNTLVKIKGRRIAAANSINDNGWIAALAVTNGTVNANDNGGQAVLLKPRKSR